MVAVGELVAEGRTSSVYEYGAGAVVKVPLPDVPNHWVQMEARFTASVRDVGVVAPEVLDVVQVGGRDAVVFERIHGPSMWQVMVESPGEIPAMARELASVHHHILCAGLPRELTGMVDRTIAKLEAVERFTEDDRRKATDMIRALPRGAALLHGDLHPANVLLGNSGPVVIDWFDASIGHPVADVVRSSILMRPRRDASTPHLPDATHALLEQLHDAYVVGMAGILGAPRDELRRWEAVIAASRLAEGAEGDDSALVDLWMGRDRHRPSVLVDSLVLSAM